MKELPFNFCPRCGSSLKLEKHDHDAVLVCQNAVCHFYFWQNSKPTVCIVISNEKGEVLMTIRAREPEKGKLDLPGGFLQEGEHPDDGTKREAQEELGVSVAVTGYLGFVIDEYTEDNHTEHTLNIGVKANIMEGTPHAASEIHSVVWVDPTTVDTKTLAFRNNEIFLQRFVEDHRS